MSAGVEEGERELVELVVDGRPQHLQVGDRPQRREAGHVALPHHLKVRERRARGGVGPDAPS